MKTIFKYALVVTDRQKINLPKGAKILCAKLQLAEIMIWCETDTEIKAVEEREIMIVGTGNAITAAAYRYISSIIDGRFVWHVFEVL